MRPVSVARHTASVAIEGLLVLATIAALIVAVTVVASGEPGSAGNALAGRSGNLAIDDGVFAGTTVATANPGTDGTWVMGECYQNGTLVYRQYVRVDPTTHQAVLTLGPTPSWTSGAASCTGEEGSWGKNGRWRAVATTTFEVSG